MVTFTNECCDCAVPGYPCIGDSCSLRHVPHFYCDDCGGEVDEGELYDFAGEELCLDCIEKQLPKVKAHDY